MVALTVAGVSNAAPAAPKKPFIIGFANTNAGVTAFPGMTQAAIAAAGYINSTGGINGHPIQLVQCNVVETPEGNQACGQQFANDSTLQMVVVGRASGSGPFWDSLAPSKLPSLESYSSATTDYSAPNATSYLGGTPGTSVGQAELANKIRGTASSAPVTIFVQDSATGVAQFNYFMARYTGDKSQVTRVNVPAAATDALPYMVKGNVTSASVIVYAIANCVAFAKTARQLGLRGNISITSSSCLSPTNLANNPGLFDGWQSPSYAINPTISSGLTSVQKSDMATFLTQFAKYGGSTAPVPTFAELTWATMMGMQKALLGKPDSVLYNRTLLKGAIRAFRGPVPLAQPQIKCGGYLQVSSALCTLATLKQQVNTNQLVLTPS
jgi:ABC-type branched-subunit amino acid transport system substrate-binding protein